MRQRNRTPPHMKKGNHPHSNRDNTEGHNKIVHVEVDRLLTDQEVIKLGVDRVLETEQGGHVDRHEGVLPVNEAGVLHYLLDSLRLYLQGANHLLEHLVVAVGGLDSALLRYLGV